MTAIGRVRESELEKAERETKEFHEMLIEHGPKLPTESPSFCSLEEHPMSEMPSSDSTNATAPASTTSTEKKDDESFPHCVIHLPAGDHHRPVLAVLREGDARKLLQGPYFSKVKSELSESSGSRGALVQCGDEEFPITFLPGKH